MTTLSPRYMPRICPCVAPNMRSTPISRRLCATAIENVLNMINSPIKSANALVKSALIE